MSAKNSVLVHRADISDGIKALYLSQSGAAHLLKEDAFSAGYREGFETALSSLAQLLGVANDFQRYSQLLERRRANNMMTVS